MFKRKLSICLAACCIIGFFGTSVPKVQSEEPEGRIQRAVDSIDGLVEKYIGESVAGVQISVAKNGEPVLLRSYGKADIEKNKDVVQETSFNYASVSKLFIWVAAMQLKERGLLDLDKDVREYLPKNYPMYIKSEKPVTFLNLMNHDAGFESLWVYHTYNETQEELNKTQLPGVDKDEKISALGKAVCLCYSGKQVFEPGDYEGYSNYGANLAAYIIECILIKNKLGERFCDYVQEYIFNKCGMQTCYPEIIPNQKTVDNKAIAYSYDGEFTKVGPYWAEGLYASGSVIGRTEDLTLFANALMPKDGKSPLFQSSDTLKEFFEITRNATGEELFSIHHGMWGSDGNFRGVGHDGSVDGMNSFFVMLPDEGLSIAVLANTDDASNMNKAIVELFTGSYYDDSEKVDTSQFVDAKILNGEYIKNRNQFADCDISSLPKIGVSAVDKNTISVAWTSSFSQNYVQIRPYVFECHDENSDDKDKIFFNVDSDGKVKKATVFQNEWIPLAEAEKVVSDAVVVAEGTCGEKATWILFNDGALKISGVGDMENFEESDVPWIADPRVKEYPVKNIVIGEGITKIGNNAFCKCDKVKTITIPSTVNKVGENIFNDAIRTVFVPESLQLSVPEEAKLYKYTTDGKVDKYGNINATLNLQYGDPEVDDEVLNEIASPYKLVVAYSYDNLGDKFLYGDIVNYKGEDGTVSTVIGDEDIAWINANGIWYGIDTKGFKPGDVVHVKNVDRVAADDKDVRRDFIVSVSHRDGSPCEDYSKPFNMYVQVDNNWDKKDISLMRVFNGEDIALDTIVKVVDCKISDSYGKIKVVELPLDDMGEFVVYHRVSDSLQPTEPTDPTSSTNPTGLTDLTNLPNKSSQTSSSVDGQDTTGKYQKMSIKTTDIVNNKTLFGLSAFMLLALGGIYVLLKKKRIK